MHATINLKKAAPNIVVSFSECRINQGFTAVASH